MTSLGANVVVNAAFQSGAVASAVDKAMSAGPQSVLVIGDANGAAGAIRDLRAKGFRGPIYGFSNTGESLLAEELGPEGAGVVVVRVVGLVDAARAADHRADARALEDAGFGAERDLAGARFARETLRQARDVVLRRAEEARDLADRLEGEAGVGRDALHRRFERLRISDDLALHGRDVGRGQVAEFVADLRVARNDVFGYAAVDLGDARSGGW